MAIGIVSGCGDSKRADERAEPATEAARADSTKRSDGGRAAITLNLVPPRPAGSGLAKRCAIAGDPIGGTCVVGGGGLAADAKGVVYVVDGERVLRYRRAAGADGCRYEPAGAPIALPPPPERKQRVDGPVYMRSGGPQWRLSRAGDAIYAADFLAGLYRIDRGRAEAACTDVFGYDHVARVGGRLLVGRSGIERLATGAKCSASAAGIDAKARGDVYVIGEQLYVAARGRTEVARYDGSTKVPVAKDVRVCSVRGLAACGDGACILDQNCMQIVQVAPDGTGRILDGDALFDRRPWSLGAAAQLTGGAMLVLAQHRDAGGANEICEAALYELPAALFER